MTATAPAATAAYNAPERPEDVVASFTSLTDAQAYADEYGGEIRHSGVVFCVSGSDHEKAKSDYAKLRALSAAETVAALGGAPAGPTPEEFDAAVAAAVTRALAARANTAAARDPIDATPSDAA